MGLANGDNTSDANKPVSTAQQAAINGRAFETAVTIGPAGSKADYVCDGTADNTDILQAYNALSAAGCGILTLLPGTFNIDAAIQFQAGNLSIVGSGVGISTLRCRYDGSGGAQNTFYGMLSYWNNDGVTPIHNVRVSNLSINLNSFSTNGIHFRSTQTAVVVSKNYRVESVDIYGRSADATGSVGCIKVTGAYSGAAGSFRNVRFKNIEIHDAATATSVPNPTGYSILMLTNDLSVFKMENCYFHDTYGTTVALVASTARTRKDWTIDNCSFANTIQVYNGNALADIDDSNALGFNGIKITNCHFDAHAGWTVSDDIYAMKIYDSLSFIVDHCVFNNCRAVIAVGLSPGIKESQNWIFSNNLVYNCLAFADPDGHYTGTYTNNIFWKSDYAIFGGYGRHYPTVYQGNLLYNCGLNPQTDITQHRYLFAIADGGNVVQDNTIYNDIASPNLLWVVAELSQGGSTTYPNIYKNNTIIGLGGVTAAFYLDSGLKHVIQNNTGLTEGAIQNYAANGSGAISALAASDVVSNNFRADGTAVSNPSAFGGNVSIGNTGQQQALTLGSSKNAAIEITTPGAAVLTPGTAGTLATGTYYYKITALDGVGETKGGTEASVSVTGPTGLVALSWASINGAASYRIYRGISAGAENTYYTSASNSLTDTGSAGAGGIPPTLTTAYIVKLANMGDSWLAGGRLGIGTATPGARLTVYGPSAAE